MNISPLSRSIIDKSLIGVLFLLSFFVLKRTPVESMLMPVILSIFMDVVGLPLLRRISGKMSS